MAVFVVGVAALFGFVIGAAAAKIGVWKSSARAREKRLGRVPVTVEQCFDEGKSIRKLAVVLRDPQSLHILCQSPAVDLKADDWEMTLAEAVAEMKERARAIEAARRIASEP